jgi:3',5'-cyclic AMP phosphodiesterase CpdA
VKPPVFLATKHLLNAFLLLPVVLAAAPAGAPKVEFLHLTDTHVTDLSSVAEPLTAARKHFENTGGELAKFLGGSTRPPGSDFILITGDLIDGFSFAVGDGRRVFGQIDAFQRATAACRVPVFVLLGNHDIAHYGLSAAGKPAADQAVAGEARAAWIAAMPSLRQGTYYAIKRQVGATRYVVLMLDNGYSAAGAKNAPGLQMAHEQLYWLRRQIEIHADATLVLAMHVPLGTDAGSQAIKGAIAGAQNIALILAGHVHKDGIDELALGEARTVQVRTAAFGYGVNNWRRVCLHPDRIEVFATGKHETVEKTISLHSGTTRSVR